MDETNVQTDSDIIAEFESLFGSASPETDTEVDEETEVEEEQAEETEEQEAPSEDEETGEESEDEESEEEEPKTKKASDPNLKKQREAFYKMRTQNKSYEKLFKRLGGLFDLTDSGDPDEVVSKIEEALLKKEAEKANVPVEVMQRLQELEAIVNQKESNDRENRVTNDLALVGEKYGLDQENMEAFLLELAEDGKNPLEADIDLETEYLKRHFTELIQAAKDEALQQETDRKGKVKEKAASGLPAKKDKSGTGSSISTMDELNSFLDSV